MSTMIGWVGVFLYSFIFAVSAGAENEAKYYPNGKLYIPKVQMLDKQGKVLQNYESTLKKKKDWVFQLTGLSPAAKPTNVSGTWTFNFSAVEGYYYENSTWHWYTNTGVNTFKIALTQGADKSVSGSVVTNGANNKVEGFVSEGYFFFNMLTGYTNNAVMLHSCQCMVESNTMDGVFYYNSVSGISLGAGDFSAER